MKLLLEQLPFIAVLIFLSYFPIIFLRILRLTWVMFFFASKEVTACYVIYKQ